VDGIEAQERSRPRALHARGVEGKLSTSARIERQL
jgi:hypothetical protein